MSKKFDIPDVIDNIFDCLEKRLTPSDMKGWLTMPNEALYASMSPNEMLKAGKARELLVHVEKEFGCECSSLPPPLVETLQ